MISEYSTLGMRTQMPRGAAVPHSWEAQARGESLDTHSPHARCHPGPGVAAAGGQLGGMSTATAPLEEGSLSQPPRGSHVLSVLLNLLTEPHEINDYP